MSDSRVKVSIEDQIAYVTLNRADKHNALDMKMFNALDKVSQSLHKNKSLRAVIVSGDGENFCTGLDIKSVLTKPSNSLKLLWKWWPGNSNLAQRVSTNWRKIPVPVIMVIHGRCWGGGLQIALGGDFRICTPSASLSIMESKWGLVPDMGGNIALRELLPVDAAMELAMTAKQIDGNEAKAMNLVTHVADDPMSFAKEYVKQFVNRSPDALAGIKRIYHQAWHKNDGQVLAQESWLQTRIIMGKNQRIATKRETGQPDKSYLPRRLF